MRNKEESQNCVKERQLLDAVCFEIRRLVFARTQNPTIRILLETEVIPDLKSSFELKPEYELDDAQDMAVHVLKNEAKRMNPRTFDEHVRKSFSPLNRFLNCTQIRKDRDALIEFEKVIQKIGGIHDQRIISTVLASGYRDRCS